MNELITTLKGKELDIKKKLHILLALGVLVAALGITVLLVFGNDVAVVISLIGVVFLIWILVKQNKFIKDLNDVRYELDRELIQQVKQSAERLNQDLKLLD
tara:strand:- start:906 stop:1208 length:303 start_codon:yes stop_codon:yes gene_type:complete